MLQFWEKYKKKVIALLITIAATFAFVTGELNINASMLESAVGVVVTPFQDIISGINSWTQNSFSTLRERSDLAEENQRLREENALLQQENRRLSLYEEENARLAALLRVSQKYPAYETIGTSIIASNPSPWHDIFTINKGTTDNVYADMVLMSAEGVVGKIIESGATYSKAQSILDSRSSIPAMSLRTGDLGIVKGDYILMNDGYCKMEYIDGDAEIMVGDEIVTSSLSEIYPPGLPIGRIISIETEANGLTKYAIIEPFADLKHLDTLLVFDRNITEETP